MRKSTGVLCVISAVSVAASVWLWGQWQHEHSANAGLQQQVAAARCPDVPAITASTSPAMTGPSRVPGPRSLKSSQADTPAPTFTSGFPVEFQQRLQKNPEFRKALRTMQRLEIEQTYRDLPRSLGLNPEQANALFDLMSEQSVKTLEAQWQKPTDGKSRGMAYEKVREQNDAELANLLGPSNMIRLNEYRSSMQSRTEVDSVRNELARGPEPMREDQVDPMVAIVSTEVQRMNQELRDVGSANVDGMSFDAGINGRRTQIVVATNQRILDGSRSILTSSQSAGLEQLYRRQRQQMETQDQMARIQAETAQSAMSD